MQDVPSPAPPGLHWELVLHSRPSPGRPGVLEGHPSGASPPPLSKRQLPIRSPTSSSFPGCFQKLWPPFLIDRSPVHQRSMQTVGPSPPWAGGSS